jgi:protease YdgD
MRQFAWLALVAVVGGVTPAVACPDWQKAPSFGEIPLVEGFQPDPFYRNITAGGTYSLQNCFPGQGWSGTVASAPDFDIYYQTSGASTLTIGVSSGYDTMLLINDPNGNWYIDDDSGGNMDPLISIPNAPSGLYDIWIGSFGGGRGLPGQLIITERY